jgi:tetratricopeptide (TPR) repeat protein
MGEIATSARARRRRAAPGVAHAPTAVKTPAFVDRRIHGAAAPSVRDRVQDGQRLARRRRVASALAGAALALAAAAWAPLAAQAPQGSDPQPPPASPGAAAPDTAAADSAAPDSAAPAAGERLPLGSKPERRAFDDPWDAYEAGAYDQALRGFVDRQVERPEDPRARLDVGSAHYRLRDWPEAERAFAAAAASGDPKLRARALYNLGNTAFRRGQLEEAVARYQAALAADPDDPDAKFNLEFVRDEIRRRLEEAKKRQEQQQPRQQQGQPDGQENPDQGGQGEQDQQGQDPPRQEQRQAGSPSEPAGPDADRDGLPDEVERSGANPTDPRNPDTDGDGRLDGEEDADRDGAVDPGETDPNRPDAPAGAAGAGPAGAPQEAPGDRELTPEEAERYLQALGEGQPRPQAPPEARAGRRAKPDKDW